ncbi:MAG: NnrU family protein, partial [bacterium]
MTILVIGVSLFVLIHLMPSVVPLRTAIFNKLGEGPYKGVYSIISLVGLGLIIYGKAVADYIPVFDAPEWARYLAWVMMVPALVLIVGANVP